MLICTLLTFAMCADPTVQAAIGFDDMTVPIVWTRRDTGSCIELGHPAAGGPGDARMQFAFHGTVRNVTVTIADARIEMTAYQWPNMNAADSAALLGQYRASLWHEIGHLVVALSSIAVANAAHLTSTAAFAQIRLDQERYDADSMHGIQQNRLASALAGANTIIICSRP